MLSVIIVVMLNVIILSVVVPIHLPNNIKSLIDKNLLSIDKRAGLVFIQKFSQTCYKQNNYIGAIITKKVLHKLEQSICDTRLRQIFILIWNSIVWDQNKFKLWSITNYLFFDCGTSFIVLIKSGMNYVHFAWTIMYELKPRGFLCSKNNYFQSQSYPPPIWTNFEWKCTETSAYQTIFYRRYWEFTQ